MSENQNTQAVEQSNTPTNADQTNGENKNSRLVIFEKIENTPFYINGNEKQGYFLRLGDYRITDYIPKEEILGNPNDETPLNETELQMYFGEYLIDNQWNILLTVIAAINHANGHKNVELK